jgi:hypothetical protein
MALGFFASVNGEITPAAEARVSVLDNGFTFGDGVYETLRTYAGRPFLLDRHLQRLRASAGRLGIEVPLGDAELGRRVDALLERAANPESYIRIILTRGQGDISYNFARVQGPTVVIVVKPLPAVPDEHYRDGVDVVVAAVRRNHRQALDPAIKSCNLLNNILAAREAQARGTADAILLNQEGTPAARAAGARGGLRAGRAAGRGRGLPDQHHPRGLADPRHRRDAGGRRAAGPGHAAPAGRLPRRGPDPLTRQRVRGSRRASSQPGRKIRTPTSISRSIAVVLGVPKNAVAATSVTSRPVTCSTRPR